MNYTIMPQLNDIAKVCRSNYLCFCEIINFSHLYQVSHFVAHGTSSYCLCTYIDFAKYFKIMSTSKPQQVYMCFGLKMIMKLLEIIAIFSYFHKFCYLWDKSSNCFRVVFNHNIIVCIKIFTLKLIPTKNETDHLQYSNSN